MVLKQSFNHPLIEIRPNTNKFNRLKYTEHLCLFFDNNKWSQNISTVGMQKDVTDF